MPGEQSMNKDLTNSDPNRPPRSPEMARDAVVVWHLAPADAEYPQQLLHGKFASQEINLYGVGDRAVLQRPCLGLVCSVQCPGSVVIKTYDAIRHIRDAGIVVAGGFHSPMEQDCLDFLLRGPQAVILSPARHPPTRYPAQQRQAMDERQLCVLSRFSPGFRSQDRRSAILRNELITALCAAVFVPHASPGGAVHATAMTCLARGQAVFTIPSEDNADLLQAGALPVDVSSVSQCLRSSHV